MPHLRGVYTSLQQLYSKLLGIASYFPVLLYQEGTINIIGNMEQISPNLFIFRRTFREILYHPGEREAAKHRIIALVMNSAVRNCTEIILQRISLEVISLTESHQRTGYFSDFLR